MKELLHRKVAERSIMKKLTVLLCTMALGLSLIACGADESDANQNPSTENTDGGNAGTDAGDTNTDADNTDAGNGTTNEGTDAGTTTTVAIADLKQAVVDVLGENYWPNTEMPAEFLEGYGLTADMYDAFFGEMPMISTNVDTLIIIQAKEGQVEAVEGVLNAYRENLVNDTMQYPMNVGKIQASRIETFGNFVCFVQLGADVMTLVDQGDEAVIQHCQAQNELALEAISKVAK